LRSCYISPPFDMTFSLSGWICSLRSCSRSCYTLSILNLLPKRSPVTEDTRLDMEQHKAANAASSLSYTQLAMPALLAGATAIGLAPIFVRLSQAGPSATAFWRVALALPVLYILMAAGNSKSGGYRKPSSSYDYARLSLAGLFFALDLAFWHWSIRYTSVANATLLANFAPIVVTLGAWLLFKQRASLGFALGMLLALSGTGFIVGSSLSFDPSRLLGDAFGLVTALFYGAYLLAVSRLRLEFSTGTVMTWSGAVTCLALLPVALLFKEAFLPFNWQGWLVLLGLALVSHVGGQSLIAYALAHLPASFSSVTLLVQPVMAAVFAWLILNETLHPWQAVGGALVLAGIVWARRESVAPQAKAQARAG
jgi:drug/metabolite transporter (DMT)-like permease